MPSIIVKTRRLERFRRAGLEFTRAGVELDTGDLSQEQLAAIEAEPNLRVELAEGEPADPEKKAAPGAAAARKRAAAKGKEQGK